MSLELTKFKIGNKFIAYEKSSDDLDKVINEKLNKINKLGFSISKISLLKQMEHQYFIKIYLVENI